MLSQQQTEALDVSVLAAKMARRVSIDVLSVKIDLFIDECFDYVEISTNASHVKWRAQILGSTVQIASKVRKHFNKLDVTFVCRHVHWGPTITVAFIKQRLCQLAVLLAEKQYARVVVTLLSADPDASKKLALLTSLLFLNLLLGHRGLLGLSLEGGLNDFYSYKKLPAPILGVGTIHTYLSWPRVSAFLQMQTTRLL